MGQDLTSIIKDQPGTTLIGNSHAVPPEDDDAPGTTKGLDRESLPSLPGGHEACCFSVFLLDSESCPSDGGLFTLPTPEVLSIEAAAAGGPLSPGPETVLFQAEAPCVSFQVGFSICQGEDPTAVESTGSRDRVDLLADTEPQEAGVRLDHVVVIVLLCSQPRRVSMAHWSSSAGKGARTLDNSLESQMLRIAPPRRIPASPSSDGPAGSGRGSGGRGLPLQTRDLASGSNSDQRRPSSSVTTGGWG